MVGEGIMGAFEGAGVTTIGALDGSGVGLDVLSPG